MAKQHYNLWTEDEFAAVYQEYLDGAYPSQLAKRRGLKTADLFKMFRARRWPLRPKKRPVMPMRIAHELAEAMYADYQTGMTYAAVERKYGRESKTLRNVFLTRGWPVRDPLPNANRLHRPDGTWVPQPLKTEEEIEAIIQAATRIVVPDELKLEWRKWSIARRADFIRRLRARIKDPMARPDLPFSSNVIPFDYGTEAAWEIVRKRNVGRTSQEFATCIRTLSEGVIWDGRLWFWVRIEGYYSEGVPWALGKPRPGLHRTIWQSIHGPLPPGGVVRLIDGNPNNLDPSNLTLSDRNLLCRQNQSTALTRKSRERTALILNRHQSPKNDHSLTLQDLGRRAR